MLLMSGIDFPKKSIVAQTASAMTYHHATSPLRRPLKKNIFSICNKQNDDNKLCETKPVSQFGLKSYDRGVQRGGFNFAGYIPDFMQNLFQGGIVVNSSIFKR